MPIIKKALESFQGVKRRFEFVLKGKKVNYVDDYAHHPTEIEAFLRSMKSMYPEKKLTVVFQPHLFSRTRDFYKEFAAELSLADDIMLMDIYPAREKPIEGITSSLIVDELTAKGKKVLYAQDKNEIINRLLMQVKENDIVVFQGAGDVTNLCSEFVKKLEETKK
jgi:UDP-N-acetylmuramate--alanine ligase